MGYWLRRKFDDKIGWTCPECNTTWDTNTNYCPNCGDDKREDVKRELTRSNYRMQFGDEWH